NRDSRPVVTLQSNTGLRKDGTNVCRDLRPISLANEWRCWSPPIDPRPWQQKRRPRQFLSCSPAGSTRSSLVSSPVSTAQGATPPAWPYCQPNSGQTLGTLTRTVAETRHDRLCRQSEQRRDAVSA